MVYAQTRVSTGPTVNISVNIIPPYSPYYSDYTSINATKVLLILQNLSERQVRIKLAGQLQGDNGVRIATYSNYVPLQPIILNSHETRQLNGQALKDIFDLNNLSVQGIQKGTLAQTNRLPEGNYSFCLQAYDYDTKQLLSSNAPLGCTSLNISYPEAPVLVNPMPNSRVRALPVQNVMLNWINPGNVPIGTQYKLEMAEMPDVAKDPNQVLNATSLPILSTTVNATAYNYSIKDFGLTPGKRYAWRVTAIDPNKRVTFKNNGRSAAAYFIYDPDNSTNQIASGIKKTGPPRAVAIPATGIGKAYDISGNLTYRYHDSKAEVQPGFTGHADTTMPLKLTNIQLRYGKCLVDMNIVKKMISNTTGSQNQQGASDAKTSQVNLDSLKKAYPDKTMAELAAAKYIIDSIPHVGIPKYYQVTPAEDFADNGEVLATAKTDASGNYSFKFKTNKRSYIISSAGNVAYIYCYYINIVDKHYTDPRQYIYAPTPGDETEVSTVATGTQNIYVKNYNLVVAINRNAEGGTKEAVKQNASVESNPDELVQVYILRKNTKPSVIPQDEGDNIGHPKFVPNNAAKQYFTNDSYYVVAKRNVSLSKDYLILAFTFYGQTAFSNLVDNLKNSEDYYVYAEYKNNKVFFAPQEVNEATADDDDYNPSDKPVVKNKSVTLEPTMVSVIVKGVLKYKFKNDVPKVLANVPVTLESVFFTVGDNKKIIYDFSNTNKLNETYAVTKTNADGYFELGGGDIKYKDYKAGILPFGGGFAQFVRVNSVYYGSPDNAFNFEAGNTYNVGELLSRVNDFRMKVTVQGPSVATGQTVKLAGQRVYLCRKSDLNTSALNIPGDEGLQTNLPLKTVTDVNNNTYKVISYAETNNNGEVNFDRLVVNDVNTPADHYWLYSESGILSTSNYSTEEAQARDAKSATVMKPALRNFPISNEYIDNVALNYSTVLATKAQKPYIEGAVYPRSNMSTNALSGVDVYLYDIQASNSSSSPYSATSFEAALKNTDPYNVVLNWGYKQAAKLQAHQKTSDNGRFLFNDPQTKEFNGWKLLLYTKSGFITGYDIVNSGAPMKPGSKDNKKGFLNPPRLLSALVKDKNTGDPIKAKVVVGDNFSWSHTITIPSGTNGGTAEQDTMRSSYGYVNFTVIPDDNVNYHPQTFTHYIPAPQFVQGKIVADNKLTAMDPFLMSRPLTQVKIAIKDASTGNYIPGSVEVTGLPPNEKLPVYLVMAPKYQAKIEVVTKLNSFGLKVKSQGYVAQNITVLKNEDPSAVTELTVELEKGLSINGYVTVDKAAAPGAKVYLKEFENQMDDAVTDSKGYYQIDGLPLTYTAANIVAVAPALNAIGKTQQVVLSYPPAQNGKQPSHERHVNFDLVKSKQIDFSKLYGFPFEAESVFTNFNGGILVSGRVLLPANKNIAANSSGQYLHIKSMEIVSSNGQDHGLNNQSLQRGQGGLRPLQPVKADVTVVENSQDVTLFNRYAGSMDKKSGLIIHPLDSKLTTGTVQGNLMLTAGGFARNIDWHYYPYLEPAADAPLGLNLNGSKTPGKVGDTYNNGQAGKIGFQSFPKQQSAGQQQAQQPQGNGNSQINNDMFANNVNLNFDNAKFGAQNSVLYQYNGDSNKPHGANYNPNNKPVQQPVNILFSNPADDKVNNYSFIPSYGEVFNYTLNNLYSVDAGTDSHLDANGAHFNSTIHTALENVDNPDLAIDAGYINVTEKPLNTVNGKKEITIPLDNWKLRGKWKIANGPIKLTGQLFAGSITLPVTDMEVSPTGIGYGNIDVHEVGLAGVYKMAIDPNKTLTSFGFDKAAKYGTKYEPKYGSWSLSLLSNDEKVPLTELTHLPDLNPADKIQIMNISLYSKGTESRIILQQDHPLVTVNGFGTFKPYQAENGSDYLILHGALDLNIPSLTGLGNQVYDLDFASDGSKLIHKPTLLPPLSLVTNGVRVAFDTKNQTFTNNLLVLNGNLQDKVSNSPYNFTVKLTKTSLSGQNIDVTYNKNNLIDLGAGQMLTNVKGAMPGGSKSWNNFQFEGDIRGAEGIRDTAINDTKKTHIKYEVKGDLVANKSEIGVKNLSMGGAKNINFTYDFAKKAIVGSMHIDEKTSQESVHADIEMQMGNGQWYMFGSCKIDSITGNPIPVNGAGGAMCIGKCTLTPEMKTIFQSQFHNGVLPNDFSSKFGDLKGMLTVTSVELNIPIIPDINLDLGPIAHATVEKGIYCNSYQRLTFEDSPILDGGIKVGAYVKVTAGASVLVGCAGLALSAEMNGQVNTELVLPTYAQMLTLNPITLLKKSKLTMNAEEALLLGGSAYIGYGVCDDDCNSIKVWGVKIPPGCHKTGIGKDMTIKFGVDVFKDFEAITPNRSDIYFTIFGKKTTQKINIPNL